MDPDKVIKDWFLNTKIRRKKQEETNKEKDIKCHFSQALPRLFAKKWTFVQKFHDLDQFVVHS